jgi:hypothetical protein
MRFRSRYRWLRMLTVGLHMTLLIPIYLGVIMWVIGLNAVKLIFNTMWVVVWDYVTRTKELIEVNDHD